MASELALEAQNEVDVKEKPMTAQEMAQHAPVMKAFEKHFLVVARQIANLAALPPIAGARDGLR